jgi:dihydrofolate reductase
MGRIVATEFVSLDGVFEDPGGSEGTPNGAWTFKFNRGDEGDAFKFDELKAADAQLLGRVTYQGFAKAWPTFEDEAGFAAKMNSMPKHVVSKTLENPTWENTEVIDGDLDAAIAKLKGRYDGDILIAGSGQLVRGLLAKGLIDELRLMVYPVVLGSGRTLFGGMDGSATLRLASTKPVGPDGVVILTYEPAG